MSTSGVLTRSKTWRKLCEGKLGHQWGRDGRTAAAEHSRLPGSLVRPPSLSPALVVQPRTFSLVQLQRHCRIRARPRAVALDQGTHRQLSPDTRMAHEQLRGRPLPRRAARRTQRPAHTPRQGRRARLGHDVRACEEARGPTRARDDPQGREGRPAAAGGRARHGS